MGARVIWGSRCSDSCVTPASMPVGLTFARDPRMGGRAGRRTRCCRNSGWRRAKYLLLAYLKWVRLFFVEEFLPYSWAFLPADASLQCSFRGDSNQSSAYPRLFRRPAEPRNGTEHRRSVPLGRAPFWTFARRSGTVPWEGRQTCDGCDDRIPGTYIRRAANRRPLHRSPEPSPVRSGRGRIPDFPEQCVGKDGL